MNLFVRWVRFNLVGAMGMAVQLGALALLSRCDRGHYLIASAAAVEIAVLHNFAWHLRVTWPDRREGGEIFSRWVRFQVANGMVSQLGNVGLMRVLAGNAHMPLLMANSIAIVCCSIINFCLGHTWAFAGRPQQVECRT